MDPDDVAERARQRDLVRRGYDVISLAYRSDDGEAAGSSAEDVSRYAGWVAGLAGRLEPGATVVDLGCGAGIPATRELSRHGLRVIGADFSTVQLRRAQRLVPAARLVQADMAALHLRPASVDAVVSFYALIHVPVADQRTLFPRIRLWLRPGGYFLAIVGATQWTGTERYLGAEMFWDHADTGTYLRWLQAARLTPVWDRYVRGRWRPQPDPRLGNVTTDHPAPALPVLHPLGLSGPMSHQPAAVRSWHAVVASQDVALLDDLLAEEVLFRSPAVFAPQPGKALTARYLTSAMVVLGPSLRYLHEWHDHSSAVLEFEAELEGIYVQGVDMLRWNSEDKLVSFTVMVRPLRGLEKLIELMARQLADGQT